MVGTFTGFSTVSSTIEIRVILRRARSPLSLGCLKTSATSAADRLYFFAIPALSKPLFKSPRTDDTVITVVGCVATSCATVASIAI